jgi:hypothetical protein
MFSDHVPRQLQGQSSAVQLEARRRLAGRCMPVWVTLGGGMQGPGSRNGTAVQGPEYTDQGPKGMKQRHVVEGLGRLEAARSTHWLGNLSEQYCSLGGVLG